MYNSIVSKDHKPGFLARALNKYLPSRTKRLILITSIFGTITGETHLDKSRLHKLNQMMHLCTDDKALEFPLRMSSVIWKGHAKELVLYKHTNDDNQIETITSRITAMIPCWLEYADSNVMHSDIYSLIKNKMLLV